MRPRGCVPYAQNALGSDQFDELVRHGGFHAALAVRLEVAQVADVAFLVVGSTMRLVEWVDWLEQESQPSAISHQPPRCYRVRGSRAGDIWG